MHILSVLEENLRLHQLVCGVVVFGDLLCSVVVGGVVVGGELLCGVVVHVLLGVFIIYREEDDFI